MRKLVKWLATAGVACFALAATVVATAPCAFYLYQPKTPANLRARLKK
jgi:cyclic lactone autoinducer peptide